MRIPILDLIHERYIKSFREHILNNSRTFSVHFQGYGDHIKVPLLNILDISTYLPTDILKYIYCSDHILLGRNKYEELFSNEFIGTIQEVYLEKKYIYLHILDGNSVCKSAQKIIEVQWPSLTCIVCADQTTQNISSA